MHSLGQRGQGGGVLTYLRRHDGLRSWVVEHKKVVERVVAYLVVGGGLVVAQKGISSDENLRNLGFILHIMQKEYSNNKRFIVQEGHGN